MEEYSSKESEEKKNLMAHFDELAATLRCRSDSLEIAFHCNLPQLHTHAHTCYQRPASCQQPEFAVNVHEFQDTSALCSFIALHFSSLRHS